jgi:2-C-methyl-D-erythritol 4-phosphate cytidylyltransferase
MTSAVIVAAGRGTRMGPDVDKLFLEVAGRPVIAHTWDLFDRLPAVDHIVLVVRDGWQDAFAELARECRFRKPWQLAPGGKERQDSVWNGIHAVAPLTEIVAIHDGARPATPPAAIEQTIAAARRTGAAVTGQRVTDTIKESDGTARIARNVDRSRLWAVQTPQAFRLEVIRQALAAVRERGLLVTDDTAACELIGQPVELVENPQPNPKVTLPSDLPYLDWLLRNRPSNR